MSNQKLFIKNGKSFCTFLINCNDGDRNTFMMYWDNVNREGKASIAAQLIIDGKFQDAVNCFDWTKANEGTKIWTEIHKRMKGKGPTNYKFARARKNFNCLVCGVNIEGAGHKYCTECGLEIRRLGNRMTYKEAVKVLNRVSWGSTIPTVMAPSGQAAAQWPQLRDSSPVTSALPSTRRMVSFGQTGMQRPQPVHFFLSMIVVTIRSFFMHFSLMN